MDHHLTCKADLVLAVSQTLCDRKIPLNPNCHYSPHGVDVEHFAQAQDASLPSPPDIQDIPQPVIGFFGLLEERFDLEMLQFLAHKRPAWSFVMIGRVAVPQSQIPHLPNIHYLGKRPYEDLPQYGRHFRVGIIPYKVSDQAHFGNPLKLREYLAMGKPVVSLGSPEAETFSDIVEIALNREDFLTRLDKLVSEPDTPEAIATRMARVGSSSWDARVDAVLRLVNQSLAQKSEEQSVARTDIEPV